MMMMGGYWTFEPSVVIDVSDTSRFFFQIFKSQYISLTDYGRGRADQRSIADVI